VGGFLGIGGASWKTDRANVLTSFADLKNVFNFALPAAKQSVGAGQELLGSAGSYFKNLLTGNRSALLGAVAPETAAAQARSDASRRQLATSGTARGGGTAAASQTAKEKTMSDINNLLFGVRPGAAEGAAKVGGEEAALGTKLTGLGLESAGTLGELGIKAREEDYKINQDMVAKVATTIENVLAVLA
jgi:hypothetical protein